MKKLFIAMGFLTIVMSPISCSKEELSTPDEQAQRSQREVGEWAELEREIERLDHETFGSMGTTKSSDDTNKWLNDIMNADGCTDQGGFFKHWTHPVIGTVSVYASIKQADKEGLFQSSQPFKDNPLSDLMFSPQSGIDSVGYYHNKAILDLYETAPAKFTSANIADSSFVDDLCTTFETAYGLTSGSVSGLVTSNQNVMSVVNLVKTLIGNNQPVTSAFTSGLSINLTDKDNFENAVKANEHYCEKVSTANSSTDIRVYTQKFLALGMSTLKTQQSRDMFKAGVLVSYASYRLWNPNAVE